MTTSNSMHTAGPWIFEPHGAFGTRFCDQDWPFGYISTSTPQPIFEIKPILEFPRKRLLANARLMAAAPDLLEALVELDRVYETGDFETEFRPALDRARAAIAKATGGAA